MSVCLLGLGGASCGLPPDDGASVETRAGNLYYLMSKLWGQRDIPVCWQSTPGNADEREWVRQALRGHRSWSEAGNVNFTGWGTCVSGAKGILITGGVKMSTVYLSRTDTGIATMELDFRSPLGSYPLCTANSLSREDCIKTAAIHEFGHAIGYAHEHNRTEGKPASCTKAPQGTDGDATFGEWDDRALMNYCATDIDLSPLERRGTDRLYKQAYGDSTHLGDYNGDGADDLLCHDPVYGDKWVDRAASGQYNGTNWETHVAWCNHDTARLFKGDFDGDGRTDLLCHDVATGDKWIDYASATGQFNGNDWFRAANWCNHATARLFVGDFNGDGRDDLLCHDIATGKKWIDYADASGQFNGTDWSRASNWCSHDTARLFVGDFNGDGRDDMLCHDVADGRKWIDYADTSGRFNGTDWSRAANFCNHDTAELHIGDFNGDRRADMLCHDTATGEKWIDFADTSGRFLGEDWYGALTFCSHNAGRVFVGDADGDTRDDLICHDVFTGQKWIDYASPSGTFGEPEWTLADGWCGHTSAELH